VHFATFKSAFISETVKAGRDVSKEHEYETKIDLFIGQVVSAMPTMRLPQMHVAGETRGM
jgi:hypothetical protein